MQYLQPSMTGQAAWRRSRVDGRGGREVRHAPCSLTGVSEDLGLHRATVLSLLGQIHLTHSLIDSPARQSHIYREKKLAFLQLTWRMGPHYGKKLSLSNILA